MRVLLDTNIIFDHVLDRAPFADDARKLMLLGYLGEIELWMSSSQATDLFYVMSNGGQASLASVVREELKEIRKAVRVCSLGEVEIDSALDSRWTDFEDACVYQCALKVKADALITRNQNDFAQSSIKVFNCAEYFAYLEKEKGLTYEEIPW